MFGVYKGGGTERRGRGMQMFPESHSVPVATGRLSSVTLLYGPLSHYLTSCVQASGFRQRKVKTPSVLNSSEQNRFVTKENLFSTESEVFTNAFRFR